MNYVSSGKDNPPTEVFDPNVLFVDMWGNWILYECWYGTFDTRVKRFVADRQRETSYFNQNYITKYIRGERK